MSTTCNIDFGFEVGNVDNVNDANLSYVKLKLGKGKEESLAMKSIVEAGTKRTLNDDDHYISIKMPANADYSELKKMIDEMTNQAGLIEEIAGTSGEKWLLISLRKYNEGSEMVAKDSYDQSQKSITEFFEKVGKNSYVEFNLKTAHNFNDARALAEQQNEVNNEGVQDNFPSFLNFMKDFSAHFKCDCDHDFAVEVMKFVAGMGAIPVTPGLFNFVKKFNSFETKMSFFSIDEIEGATRTMMNENAWMMFNESKGMLSQVRSYLSCMDDFRVFFVLRDQAYMSLEVKAPGFKNYISHLSQE